LFLQKGGFYMGVSGIDHFSINVISMEESVYFYEKVLGLEKLHSVDMGDHTLQYFNLGGEVMLELIKYHYDSGNAALFPDTKGIYRHIALKVENINAFFENLKKLDVKITRQLDFCEKLNFHNILLKDPNGVEIELLERKK
jgi:catechol 2,3-dioxygenase-like lactoylglutathione lyase family enzyme